MITQFTASLGGLSFALACAVAGPLDTVPVDVGAPSISTDDDWSFELRPYVWIVSVDGVQGINGIITPVDFSFKDILKNMDIGGAATLLIEKGPWALLIDGSYLKMSPGIDEVPFDLFSSVGIEMEQVLLSAALTYRVLEWERGFLDLGVGLNYMHMQSDVGLSLNPRGVSSISDRLAVGAVDLVTTAIGNEVRQRLEGLTLPSLPQQEGEALTNLSAEIAETIDAQSIEDSIR